MAIVFSTSSVKEAVSNISGHVVKQNSLVGYNNRQDGYAVNEVISTRRNYHAV